jgi:hypothetical protein
MAGRTRLSAAARSRKNQDKRLRMQRNTVDDPFPGMAAMCRQLGVTVARPLP